MAIEDHLNKILDFYGELEELEVKQNILNYFNKHPAERLSRKRHLQSFIKEVVNSDIKSEYKEDILKSAYNSLKRLEEFSIPHNSNSLIYTLLPFILGVVTIVGLKYGLKWFANRLKEDIRKDIYQRNSS